MKNHLRLLSLALLVLLLAVPTAAVLAKEISSLTITGPGIKGELKLDGHDDMYNLMDAGLIDTNGFMAAPVQELGTPYTINVFLDLDGKVLPFIRMDYYPMQPGQAGYVHITGRLDGESLREADDWAVMPLKADDMLRGLLAKQGVELQTAVFSEATVPETVQQAAVPPAAPAPMAAPSRPLSLYLAITAGLIVLAGAGLLLRRRIGAS